MDSVSNSDVAVNGSTESNSLQNGTVKKDSAIVDCPNTGKGTELFSNGELSLNGNETEKVKSTLTFQLKGETKSTQPSSETGSENSSGEKGSKKLEKSGSIEEENSSKKSGSKTSRLSSFAAPTKSSAAKVAGKTPENKKAGTVSNKSGQEVAKDKSVTEKKTSVSKVKSSAEVDQEKQKPKSSETTKERSSSSSDSCKDISKSQIAEKSSEEKGKKSQKSDNQVEGDQYLKLGRNIGNSPAGAGTAKAKKWSKRVIGTEKLTLEEEDLCYLKFDSCEDFSMAQAVVDPVGTAPKEGTEYIYVSDNKLKYINANYEKVQAKIYDHNCDVKLKVADQSFKAHKDVLSNASDYFSAMFRHDMKEKKSDCVELKEISPKGFAAILDYFYHGHVTIDPDNIEDVIEAARFFHNDWLLEICCDFLVRHLSLENYTAVLQLTDKFWLGDLRWDIFVFLGLNLPDLVQQEKFYQNLPMELILQFLMENVFVEASEYFILQLILDWVKHDPAKRQEHLLSLLRQVRFPVMEAEELESLPDEVMKIPEMKQAVEDAKNYVYNFMGQCLKTGDIYQPRGARPVLTVLSFSEDGNLVAYRDPEREGLFVEQLGPTGLETADYHAMCQTSIGNFLYAAGGYDETYNSISRVFRYDPKYREWTEVAPMNQPRVSFAVCSSDTKMFVFGGVNHKSVEDGETEDILSEVEVFDPQENNWSMLSALPVKCFDQAAEFCDNCLFVTGGISSDPNDPVPLDNTWCLKLDGDDGWVPKQSMTVQRQGHSMTAANGKLYVVGGYTCFGDNMSFRDCMENEAFDMETCQWTKLAPTPENIGHLYKHNAFYGNKIFMLGGSTASAQIYIYDIDTDTWEEKEVVGQNVQKLAILNVAYPHS